jgi:group I intron endonuclease
MNVFIYTLSDPRTEEVRYVGKTIKTLDRRLQEHLTTSKKMKDHRSKWIQSLVKINLTPKIEILDFCCEKKWQQTERFWIISLKFLGVNLTNQNDGGYGNHGFIFSEESKRKISKSLTGKKQSPETIEKRASKMRGRKLSPEHIAKFVATRVSRKYKMSEELKNKLKKIHKNKKLSQKNKEILRKYALIINEKNKKSVAQYSLDGVLIKIYSCAGDASRETSINISSIRMCCKNKRKKAGGFMWKFA